MARAFHVCALKLSNTFLYYLQFETVAQLKFWKSKLLCCVLNEMPMKSIDSIRLFAKIKRILSVSFKKNSFFYLHHFNKCRLHKIFFNKKFNLGTLNLIMTEERFQCLVQEYFGDFLCFFLYFLVLNENCYIETTLNFFFQIFNFFQLSFNIAVKTLSYTPWNQCQRKMKTN